MMTKGEAINNIKQAKCVPYKHETLAFIIDIIKNANECIRCGAVVHPKETLCEECKAWLDEAYRINSENARACLEMLKATDRKEQE